MGTKNNPGKYEAASRVVEPRGYVLVKVGRTHHLADIRGYAYEHRIVMEEKLGRRLAPDELVHHIDEDKGNNHQDNLALASRASHCADHKPRLGTGSDFCSRGHRVKVYASGRKRCRVCENAADRRRYGNEK